jgi:CheY-like chemotaxis protein
MAVTVMDALPDLTELSQIKRIYELAFVDYGAARSDSAGVIQKFQSMGIARHWILLGGPSELEKTFSGDLNCADFIRKPLRPQRLHDICKRMIGSERSGGDEDRYRREEKVEDIPSLKVLVADDNLVNQKVLGAILKGMGHRVETAQNGQEALEKVSAQTYEIVFMDVQMPVMDGLTATRKIKETIPASKLPLVVALTANAMEGDREKCFAAGMDDYVAKPVRPPELKKCIARHFGELGGSAWKRNSAEKRQNLLDLTYLSELTQTLDSDSKHRFVAELLVEIEAMHATFMESLSSAYAKDDSEGIRNCLHAFKSATRSLGFKRLSAHLDEVEMQAQQSDFAILVEVSGGIDSIFADSVKALNEW